MDFSGGDWTCMTHAGGVCISKSFPQSWIEQHKDKPLDPRTWHSLIGWLMTGFLQLTYFTPCITGQYNPLFRTNKQTSKVFVTAQLKVPSFVGISEKSLTTNAFGGFFFGQGLALWRRDSSTSPVDDVTFDVYVYIYIHSTHRIHVWSMSSIYI